MILWQRFCLLRDVILLVMSGRAGRGLRDRSTRKCPGMRIRAPSTGAESKGVSGRLFRIASTSASTVYSSSAVSRSVFKYL